MIFLMKEFDGTEKYLNNIKERTSKARNAKSHASSLGQWIGSIVSDGVSIVWEEILIEYEEYLLMQPERGQKQTYLFNTRGQKKEVDDIICDKKNNPIVISESKWLKDARHLNDKGAWVALMSEIKQQNNTVKGAISILAGPWNSGGNMDALNQVVRVILINTDDVYAILNKFGIEIEIDNTRNIYKNPSEPLNKFMDLIDIYADKKIDIISSLGYELVKKVSSSMRNAFEEILALPENINLINSDEIEEVVITYKTSEGYEYRELFSNIDEAKSSLKNKS